MEKIPLYLDRKFVTFIGFRFFLKVFIFFLKLYFIIIRSILFWLHCVACGIFVRYQGLSLCPQQWECGVLTTGPPGSSPKVPIFKTSEETCLWELGW